MRNCEIHWYGGTCRYNSMIYTIDIGIKTVTAVLIHSNNCSENYFEEKQKSYNVRWCILTENILYYIKCIM